MLASRSPTYARPDGRLVCGICLMLEQARLASSAGWVLITALSCHKHLHVLSVTVRPSIVCAVGFLFSFSFECDCQ